MCNVKTSRKYCTGIRDRDRPAGTCLKTFLQHDYAQQAALHIVHVWHVAARNRDHAK